MQYICSGNHLSSIMECGVNASCVHIKIYMVCNKGYTRLMSMKFLTVKLQTEGQSSVNAYVTTTFIS